MFDQWEYVSQIYFGFAEKYLTTALRMFDYFDYYEQNLCQEASSRFTVACGTTMSKIQT